MSATEKDRAAARKALALGLNLSVDSIAEFAADVRAEGVEEGRESMRRIEVTQIWKKGESECLQFVRVEDVAGMVERARLDEREACARVCDALLENPGPDALPNAKCVVSWKSALLRCKGAIRSRGCNGRQTSKDAL